MIAYLVCSCLALTLIESAQAKKLPDFIPQCKRNDPNLDKCIVDAIDVLRPQLKKGIPKLRVPPLEPLNIPELNINRDLPNLKVKAKLKNINVIGASSFKITKFKTNLDALSLDLSVTLPKFHVNADYDIDGRLLVIPLQGKGIFKGNFTNAIADAKGTGEILKNKKGVQYLSIKSVKCKIRMGDQIFKIINTDENPNNAAITNTAATFISQNRQQVWEIIKPIVEETADAIIKTMGNSVLRGIPFSELLV